MPVDGATGDANLGSNVIQIDIVVSLLKEQNMRNLQKLASSFRSIFLRSSHMSPNP